MKLLRLGVGELPWMPEIMSFLCTVSRIKYEAIFLYGHLKGDALHPHNKTMLILNSIPNPNGYLVM
jgi:hypothetical protein